MVQHNLPNLLTSFVGRQRETADCVRLLSSHRLLTLTGPGGSGKTRLAIEVVRQRAIEYPDGIWLIELAQLSDPALIPQVVASVLGLYEAHGLSYMQRLIDSLKLKHLLLILDNCEHLVDDCAHFAYTLLTTCPDLHILATSREPLHIAGEVSYLTPPLLLPDPKFPLEPAELLQNEAVHLFVERARSTLPDFDVKPENAVIIAGICRQLDGIPLAIELAAVRVKALSLAQIAAFLENSLSLLIGSDRTTPSRQQTLRAALDWSYDLLSEEEQLLFRRLSVFSGEFNLDDVVAVCSCGVIGPGNVLDLLTRLIDKSFVIANDRDSVVEWYRLLEPIRQYAIEKLETSGELPEQRNRHAEAYEMLAQRAAQDIDGAKSGLGVKLLEREIANLRSALDWSLKQGKNLPRGVALANTLVQFWQLRGYLSEGLAWMETALSYRAELPERVYAEVLNSAGFLASQAGELDHSRELNQAALEIYQGLGDRIGCALVQQRIGWLAIQTGAYDQVGELIEQCLEVYRQEGERMYLAYGLYIAGELAYLQSDLDQARCYMEKSLAICRDEDNLWAANRRLTRLAQIALKVGDTQRALTDLNESLRISLESGDQWGMMMGLLGVAAVSNLRGLPVQAVCWLAAADAILERFATRFWRVDQVEYERDLAAARATLDPENFSAAWSSGRELAAQDIHPILSAAVQQLEPPLTVPDSIQIPDNARSQTANQAAKAQFGGLTARERQVAALIAAGKTNQEIATELFVGVRTVETHITRILTKLDYTSRTQVALWVKEIDLPEARLR